MVEAQVSKIPINVLSSDIGGKLFMITRSYFARIQFIERCIHCRRAFHNMNLMLFPAGVNVGQVCLLHSLSSELCNELIYYRLSTFWYTQWIKWSRICHVWRGMTLGSYEAMVKLHHIGQMSSLCSWDVQRPGKTPLHLNLVIIKSSMAGLPYFNALQMRVRHKNILCCVWRLFPLLH